MPGMLPVINEFCVAQAVRTGLGLKAEINLNSAFDRKNYFYPDLPQGYQISQLYHPIVGEGEVLVEMGDGIARWCGSSASTWNRTRANPSTTWTPPCPSSTSTAPASR
jgi:Asp-tRNA(Asn)/Glu-tRNA(Gln) amidotransferase B subunit